MKLAKKSLQCSKTGKKRAKPRSRRGCVRVKMGERRDSLGIKLSKRGKLRAAGPKMRSKSREEWAGGPYQT